MPVALVAVLLVAAIGILGSGSQPAYGPVVETVRQGDFELTIRAEKGRYAPGEPIEITTSLTYRGSDEGVDIRHAQGAGQSPLGFGIREPVVGDLRLDPTWEQSCELTRLAPDTPLEQPFAKSAGWSSSDPRADEYRAWTADPTLRLGPGTWHVFAVAEFSTGECGLPEYVLEAEIVITVESVTPSAPPSTEQPSPSDIANPEQSATVRDGDFELTLRSDKTRYAPGEPIDLTTTLTYVGGEDSMAISHDPQGPLIVGIREPVYGVELQPLSLLTCGGSTLERGVPMFASGLAGAFAVPDGPTAESLKALLADPLLHLPVGIWHVYASAQTSCMDHGLRTDLSAEITVIVIGDAPIAEWLQIPLMTVSSSILPGECPFAFEGGRLVANATSGIGVEGADGQNRSIRWPFGYTGWQVAGDVVLVDPQGQVVARSGHRVQLGGGLGADDIFNVCGIGIIIDVVN